MTSNESTGLRVVASGTTTEKSMRRVLALLFCATLSACYYTPSVITRYDDQCDIEFKKMELTEHQLSLLKNSRCTDAIECTAVVAVQVLAAPVSAVVSGSIVLVGNTVYWMQKQGRCLSVARTDLE